MYLCYVEHYCNAEQLELRQFRKHMLILMNEAVYHTISKASEHEVLGRHIRAQFAGIAIHTRRIRREVGDAEILQGVRIGGMDQFMRKQA